MEEKRKKSLYDTNLNIHCIKSPKITEKCITYGKRYNLAILVMEHTIFTNFNAIYFASASDETIQSFLNPLFISN